MQPLNVTPVRGRVCGALLASPPALETRVQLSRLGSSSDSPLIVAEDSIRSSSGGNGARAAAGSSSPQIADVEEDLIAAAAAAAAAATDAAITLTEASVEEDVSTLNQISPLPTG